MYKSITKKIKFDEKSVNNHDAQLLDANNLIYLGYDYAPYLYKSLEAHTYEYKGSLEAEYLQIPTTPPPSDINPEKNLIYKYLPKDVANIALEYLEERLDLYRIREIMRETFLRYNIDMIRRVGNIWEDYLDPINIIILSQMMNQYTIRSINILLYREGIQVTLYSTEGTLTFLYRPRQIATNRYARNLAARIQRRYQHLISA